MPDRDRLRPSRFTRGTARRTAWVLLGAGFSLWLYALVAPANAYPVRAQPTEISIPSPPPSPEEIPRTSPPTPPVTPETLSQIPPTIRVEGVKTGSSAWVTGLVGVIGAIGGGVANQWLSARFSRTERRSDRSIAKLDAMTDALRDLDAAYEAAGVENPTPEANNELLRCLSAYNHSVVLVDDQEVRTLAETWATKKKVYAVTQNEPEEEGPTQDEVTQAQSALLCRVREIVSSSN